MMNTVELLAAKNPDLTLFDVFDKRFSRYGRVLELGDTSALHQAMLKISIPESGNCYVADDASLKTLNIMPTEQMPIFSVGKNRTKIAKTGAKGYAESYADSAPQSTWRV